MAHTESLILLAAVPPTARTILDVGCVEGRLGAALKERDPARVVYGIEHEPTAAAEARHRLDAVFRLDVETADPPLEPGSVDCLLYDNVLAHLHDPGAVLARHRPLLAPGGCVLCAVPNVQHHALVAALLRGDFPHTGPGPLDAGRRRFFTCATFTELLLDAGFAPELLDAVRLPCPPGLPEAAAPLLHYLGLHPGPTGRYLDASHYVFRGTPEPGLLVGQAAAEPAEPLSFVVCVSDEAILGATLLRSPCLGPGSPHEVVLLRGCGSAAEGLRRGLAAAKHPLAVWVHQDVYLPRGWPERFVQQYRLAAERFGPVGVAGVYGAARRGAALVRAGHVVDRDRLLREATVLPALVDTLDEVVLALPRDTPLTCAPELGFHLYGADVCLDARRRGLAAVALDALCFHHSRTVELPRAFAASAEVLARSWPGELPVATSCGVIGTAVAPGGPTGGFPAPVPGGNELASVVILCCNEVEYTRQCLESVLRHTRAPYELVLVDNGSSDGTPAFLEEVRRHPGPVGVEVIHNATNVGFPAGCNQALARARGDYLVLLNNDTVVTAGWLDGLVGWALHDWPTVGLVGPVTNYSRPPQQIAVDYTTLDGLDAFAARRRREYAGKAVEADRLTGFCLLLRRAVFERIGGFDERYGLGFFDDDDLSVRARQAGFRLLVAQDVFVHHFGSRTFTALGVDCPEQLRRNFEQFRAKWGEEHAAGYHLPAVAASVPLARSSLSACKRDACGYGASPRVSLCLIVKDEEANLADCLRGAADLVGEVVVVDTGSTDRTKEVAAHFGGRVFDFPWCDSFAAARNECLRHATGDWVFWLDADDRLDDENRTKLRTLLAGLADENAAYAMKCLCLPDPVTKAATVVDHVRLFRNRPDVRWQYRVHEQILPAVRRAGGEVRWADVVIRHVGYQDPALRRRKLDRDLRLLHLEDAERPDDPFTLFNLGSVYQELGRPSEALAVLCRSLERSHPHDSIVRKLYALVVQCHRQLGQPREALTACEAGRSLYPDDAELLFSEAMLRRELGDPAGAEACLVRLLGAPEAEHFASLDAGLRGYKARHNLAVLYQEQGRHAEAEAQWRAALAERGDFLPAWLGLAEVYLAQQRWRDLDETLGHLGGQPEGAPEAAVVRARVYLARREFAPARQVLQAAITEHPQALWPRVILSHVLLQQGTDWHAAERALHDVLALDPHHAEALRNLAVLHRQRGHGAGAA
jgi:GT2 family glycosyltransferase/tetratricopeptide (TPR) repeat protein/SAM-dependent methyltransferase